MVIQWDLKIQVILSYFGKREKEKSIQNLISEKNTLRLFTAK